MSARTNKYEDNMPECEEYLDDNDRVMRSLSRKLEWGEGRIKNEGDWFVEDIDKLLEPFYKTSRVWIKSNGESFPKRDGQVFNTEVDVEWRRVGKYKQAGILKFEDGLVTLNMDAAMAVYRVRMKIFDSEADVDKAIDKMVQELDYTPQQTV